MTGSASAMAGRANGDDFDPKKELPRDGTGSYLHLKLKRYKTVDDLSMPYARRTWRDTPHDAEVDESPSSRSSCRQCHGRIEKGAVRFRLWLQCHKGCKNSAYFHDGCIFDYPETKKLGSHEEFVGWDRLPREQRNRIRASFESMKDEESDGGEQRGNRRKMKHDHDVEVNDGDSSNDRKDNRKETTKSPRKKRKIKD